MQYLAQILQLLAAGALRGESKSLRSSMARLARILLVRGKPMGCVRPGGFAMIRSIAATLITLVMMGCLPALVHADSFSGTLSGNSTLTPTGTPGVFVQDFTGTGSDTVFGAFTVTSQSTIDFSAPPTIVISSGSFVEDLSGGTLFGTSSGSGTASGKGTATFTLDFVITGGTGSFAGDTGDATVTGTITMTSPTTESITGSYTGSLTPVTTTPEPSSVALMLLGVGLVFVMRKHTVQRLPQAS
jgi:PEP-CTERM motif-containing protein